MLNVLFFALTAADPIFYQLQVDYPTGVKGTVTLNGVVISSFGDNGGSLSAALNAWLKPDANKLEITLVSGKPETGAKLQASVVAGQRGQFGDALPKLAELAWAAADGVPKTVGATFAAKDAPSHMLWSKAEAAPLDDPAKAEIAVLIKALHAAVAKRNAKAIETLFDFKMKDMARAMGDNADDGAAAISGLLSALPKKTKPVALKPLVYTPMAEGKLVKVTSAGAAPIVLKDKEGQISMDVTVAKLDGRWTIVR